MTSYEFKVLGGPSVAQLLREIKQEAARAPRPVVFEQDGDKVVVRHPRTGAILATHKGARIVR